VIDLDEPARVTYEGPDVLSSALVNAIEREGGRVEWDPPEKRRGGVGPDIAETVLVNLIVWGITKSATAAARAGRDRFRKRYPGAASIEIEGDDDSSS